jgi:peptide/nickel transport system permease protein
MSQKKRGRALNYSLTLGMVIVGFFILMALLVPFMGLEDPATQNLSLQFAGPSAKHWLGNGVNGVDLLSQLCWGSRLSVFVGVGSVLLAAFIGLTLGSVSGYFRGRIDAILMRTVDTLYAFPGLLLVVALAAVLGPGIKNLVIVMSICSWAGYARLTRGLTLSLREREFILAARAQGASSARIIGIHLWPNLLPILLVQMTFGLGAAIMTESSLSFLGLGAPPESASWGQMINQGRELLLTAPRLVLVPGTALVLAVLGLNLLGDGLRDRLDPRKIEHRGT